MDSSCRSSASRFVVRHTFIDVADLPAGRRLRTRASSESDLFRKCPFEELPTLRSLTRKEPAKQRRAADGGLSDAETMSLDGELLVEEGHAPRLAFPRRTSDSQSEVGSECGSTLTPPSHWSYTIQSDAGNISRVASLEADTECDPVATPLSQWSRATQSEASGGSHIDLSTERVASLETCGQPENLRYRIKNRSLRAGLAISAPSGAGVADPPPGRPQTGQPLAKADDRTTVMLRNLPNNYTRAMLLTMLNKEGFAGLYDFLYLPLDFKTGACLGYAFVNLVNAVVTAKFWRALDGYCSWAMPSRKVCHIGWSGPHQGLQAHIKRYRNSPVMHESVCDECKPVVFKDGVRMAFPEPTKATKAPRLRMDRAGNRARVRDAVTPLPPRPFGVH